MNFLGFVIGATVLMASAVAFSSFLLEKQRVSENTADDRFSGRQRVLDTGALARRGVHATGGGILHPGHEGRIMAKDQTTQGHLAALAAERARYAAAITKRAAAAKRRLALAVTLSALAGVLALLALADVLAWGWVAAPLVVLVATLGLGIRATKVGRDNDAIMEARIERLKFEARAGDRSPREAADARALGDQAMWSVRDEIKKRRDAQAQAGLATAEEGQAEAEQAQPVEARAKVEEAQPTAEETPRAPATTAEKPDQVADKPEPTAGTPARPTPAPRATVAHLEDLDTETATMVSVPRRQAVPVAPAAEATPGTGDPFAHPLTPMPLPPVAVTLRPLIQDGDIDTKQLLRQQRSRVPFRPTTPVTPEGVPLTSAEVAAGAPVQFNVDAILDRRRAVGD